MNKEPIEILKEQVTLNVVEVDASDNESVTQLSDIVWNAWTLNNAIPGKKAGCAFQRVFEFLADFFFDIIVDCSYQVCS